MYPCKRAEGRHTLTLSGWKPLNLLHGVNINLFYILPQASCEFIE